MSGWQATQVPVLFGGPGSIATALATVPADARIAVFRGGSAQVANGVWPGMQERLGDRLAAELAGIAPEPEYAAVDASIERLREIDASHVIALGGGSVIDTAKACAAMVGEEGSVRDYLEGVGDRKLHGRSLPVIAIPTTAGTGAEATRNSVVSGKVEGFKRSLRHACMVPAAAVLDPAVMAGMPARVGGPPMLDALTQLLEALVSRKASPFSRQWARGGLISFRKALAAAHWRAEAGDWTFPFGDPLAAEKLQLAAFSSGVALANGGLGAAHGLAPALGVTADVPHGAACAFLLGPTIRLNSAALGCDQLYDEAARLLGLDGSPSLLPFVEALRTQMGLPQSWRALGVERDVLPLLVDRASSGSLSGNPITLDREAVLAWLEAIE